MEEKKINWLVIFITAVLSALGTLGSGWILSWIQNDELKLTYTTIETVPFEGNNRHFGVYHVSFSNDGKKQITDLVCFIKIPSC
jgi:hypothetical protein